MTDGRSSVPPPYASTNEHGRWAGVSDRKVSDRRVLAASPAAVVLIVDDDRDAREISAELLGSLGVETIVAGSVDEALRVLRTTRLTLVVTDYAMPEWTGLDLLDEMRRVPAWRPIPVLVVSGHAGPDLDELVRSRGARLLHKPVDLRELASAVRSARPRRRPWPARPRSHRARSMRVVARAHARLRRSPPDGSLPP